MLANHYDFKSRLPDYDITSENNESFATFVENVGIFNPCFNVIELAGPALNSLVTIKYHNALKHSISTDYLKHRFYPNFQKLFFEKMCKINGFIRECHKNVVNVALLMPIVVDYSSIGADGVDGSGGGGGGGGAGTSSGRIVAVNTSISDDAYKTYAASNLKKIKYVDLSFVVGLSDFNYLMKNKCNFWNDKFIAAFNDPTFENNRFVQLVKRWCFIFIIASENYNVNFHSIVLFIRRMFSRERRFKICDILGVNEAFFKQSMRIYNNQSNAASGNSGAASSTNNFFAQLDADEKKNKNCEEIVFNYDEELAILNNSASAITKPFATAKLVNKEKDKDDDDDDSDDDVGCDDSANSSSSNNNTSKSTSLSDDSSKFFTTDYQNDSNFFQSVIVDALKMKNSKHAMEMNILKKCFNESLSITREEEGEDDDDEEGEETGGVEKGRKNLNIERSRNTSGSNHIVASSSSNSNGFIEDAFNMFKIKYGNDKVFLKKLEEDIARDKIGLQRLRTTSNAQNFDRKAFLSVLTNVDGEYEKNEKYLQLLKKLNLQNCALKFLKFSILFASWALRMGNDHDYANTSIFKFIHSNCESLYVDLKKLLMHSMDVREEKELIINFDDLKGFSDTFSEFCERYTCDVDKTLDDFSYLHNDMFIPFAKFATLQKEYPEYVKNSSSKDDAPNCYAGEMALKEADVLKAVDDCIALFVVLLEFSYDNFIDILKFCITLLFKGNFQRKALFLIGKTNSYKSTLAKLIKKTVETVGKELDTFKATSTVESSKADFDLLARNASFKMAILIDDVKRWCTDRIKHLINDVPLTTRDIQKSESNMVNITYKIIFTANNGVPGDLAVNNRLYLLYKYFTFDGGVACTPTAAAGAVTDPSKQRPPSASSTMIREQGDGTTTIATATVASSSPSSSAALAPLSSPSLLLSANNNNNVIIDRNLTSMKKKIPSPRQIGAQILTMKHPPWQEQRELLGLYILQMFNLPFFFDKFGRIPITKQMSGTMNENSEKYAIENDPVSYFFYIIKIEPSYKGISEYELERFIADWWDLNKNRFKEMNYDVKSLIYDVKTQLSCFKEDMFYNIEIKSVYNSDVNSML